MLDKIQLYQNEFLLRFNHVSENEKVPAIEAFVETLTPLITAAEKRHSREAIIESLSMIRNEIRLGPLVQQSQDWIKGYQGDFETIRYVLQNDNQAPPGTLAYFIEEMLLKDAVCQQHRNKLKQQELLIKETIAINNEAGIISIGCGISEDVVNCLDEFFTSNAKITLLDVDQDALDYSSLRLADIAHQVKYIQGNIYKNIIRLEEQYDLVLLGGVCDYLNDNFLSAILKKLQRCLKPGGRIFFTNIKTGSPFRIYLEFLSNWILIERSEDDLRTILDTIMLQNMYYLLETDTSGITYMVTINNTPDMISTGKALYNSITTS